MEVFFEKKFMRDHKHLCGSAYHSVY